MGAVVGRLAARGVTKAALRAGAKAIAKRAAVELGKGALQAGGSAAADATLSKLKGRGKINEKLILREILKYNKRKKRKKQRKRRK